MNSQHLYEAIGLLEDKYITEVEDYLKNKSAIDTSKAITVNENQEIKTLVPAKRTSFWSAQFAGVIAAALVLVFATVMMFSMLAPDDVIQPDDDVMKGLPVSNVRFQDLWGDAGVIPSAATIAAFAGLFCPTRSVAIVQVENVSVKDVYNDEEQQEFLHQTQLMNIRIIETIHCQHGTQAGEVFEYGQNSYPGWADKFDINGNEHWLREGGIYIVPITVPHCDCEYAEGSMCLVLSSNMYHTFWIHDKENVLFEIDDNGLIFSHSRNPTFSYYDGKPYSVLLDEIKRLHSNEEFVTAAEYGFARQLFRRNTTLAEIVISDVEVELERELDVIYAVKANTQRIIHGLELPALFNFSNINFHETGERLLAFIARYGADLDWETNPRYSLEEYAKLDNGVIRAASDDEWIVGFFNNYTIDELKQLVERLTSFAATFEYGAQPQPPNHTEQSARLAVIEQYSHKMSESTAAHFRKVINAGFPDSFRIRVVVDLAPLAEPSGEIYEGITPIQSEFLYRHIPDAVICDVLFSGNTGRDGWSQLGFEAALAQLLNFITLDEVLYMSWQEPYIWERGDLFVPAWSDIYFDFDSKQAARDFESAFREQYLAMRLEAAINQAADDIANHGNGVIVPDEWLITPPWENPETLAAWNAQFQSDVEHFAYAGAFKNGHVLVPSGLCSIGMWEPLVIEDLQFGDCSCCKGFILYTADGVSVPLAEAYESGLISTAELRQVHERFADAIEAIFSRVLSGTDIWK
jgi:hypothetical protein